MRRCVSEGGEGVGLRQDRREERARRARGGSGSGGWHSWPAARWTSLAPLQPSCRTAAGGDELRPHPQRVGGERGAQAAAPAAARPAGLADQAVVILCCSFLGLWVQQLKLFLRVGAIGYYLQYIFVLTFLQ